VSRAPENMSKEPYIYEKRPTKETYTYRNLIASRSIRTKDARKYVKRAIYIYEKRPTKETYTYRNLIASRSIRTKDLRSSRVSLEPVLLPTNRGQSTAPGASSSTVTPTAAIR